MDKAIKLEPFLHEQQRSNKDALEGDTDLGPVKLLLERGHKLLDESISIGAVLTEVVRQLRQINFVDLACP